MENPAVKRDGERSELKHLSRDWKRNRRDSVSKRRAKAEEPKPCRKAWGCGADDMGPLSIIESPGKASHRA